MICTDSSWLIYLKGKAVHYYLAPQLVYMLYITSICLTNSCSMSARAAPTYIKRRWDRTLTREVFNYIPPTHSHTSTHILPLNPLSCVTIMQCHRQWDRYVGNAGNDSVGIWSNNHFENYIFSYKDKLTDAIKNITNLRLTQIWHDP